MQITKNRPIDGRAFWPEPDEKLAGVAELDPLRTRIDRLNEPDRLCIDRVESPSLRKPLGVSHPVVEPGRKRAVVVFGV